MAPFIGDIGLFIDGPPVVMQKILFAALKPLAIVLGYRRKMLDHTSKIYGHAISW